MVTVAPKPVEGEKRNEKDPFFDAGNAAGFRRGLLYRLLYPHKEPGAGLIEQTAKKSFWDILEKTLDKECVNGYNESCAWTISSAG